MSLKTKYLLVLNGLILFMWTAYASWSLHKTEEQFMKAEVDSIEHLGIGLKLLAGHYIRSHGTVDGLQHEVESLLPDESGLDIMLIDRSSIVRVATQKNRIGKKWFEKKIGDVFRGNRNVVVTYSDDHYHVGRQAIDITVGVRDVSGKIAYVVHIARWLEHLSGALNTQLISHGLFALAMLVVVGAAINLLTYLIVLRPLHSMNTALRESGWLSSHPEVKSGNEIQKVQAALKDVIGQFNRQTSDLQKRLQRSERLAVIGQMGAVLAHEIRNPLHIVRGTAETILRRFPDSNEFAVDIKEEVDRVERLIEELLHYSRQATPRFEEIEAVALLESVRDRVQKSVDASGSSKRPPTIEIDSKELVICADATMLEQALTNLVLNALEASPDDKPIKMTAHFLPPDEIVFEVLDSGTGIAEEDIEKATEPFFTRKARGTGLGLAVVEKIADLHDGSFALARRENGGTKAVLRVSQSNEVNFK